MMTTETRNPQAGLSRWLRCGKRGELMLRRKNRLTFKGSFSI
jgi:hypothetical protein